MIVIDAGHGGNDPGTSGNGIIEKDLALDIAKYLYDRFKELDIPVKIIRSTDETISPEERVRRILDAYGNNSDVLVLSNHLNFGGGEGAEIVYALRNNDTLSKLILEEMIKEGQQVRRYYQKRLPSDTSKDYYFIHRNTGVTEPLLIEYGFLDNIDDANYLKQNYKRLGEAVVRAISEYKNYNYEPPTDEKTYIVQKGDSLYSIARKFGTTVDSLKNLNSLLNDNLKIGQILIISNNKNQLYIVGNGDSLYSIANKYNTTVNDIKTLNNLTSNILQLGQQLLINNNANNNYIVQKGDSLYSIANKYNTTVNDIKTLNNLNNNILTIGQSLKLE